MTNEKPKRTRLFFVDNLRILLTVVVVLHHLAIVYGASGDFPYKEARPDELASIVLSLFTAVNAPYFMGFFFMISGYFVPGSYDRKGMGLFLKDRLLRLGIPVLFYIMVIHPLLGYALAATVRGGAGPFWGYFVRHVSGYSDYGLGVGPMWFVVVLLIFTILYGLWRQLAKPTTNPPQGDSKAPGNVAIAVFALGLGLVTWIVRIWYPIDRWVTILLMPVEIAHLPQYIILFVIGIIAYRRNWFVGISDAVGKVWLGIAIVCIVLLPIIFVAGGVMEGKVDLFKGGVQWQAVVTAFWEAFLCMGMVVGLLVLFRKRFNQQGTLAKAMSASAYTVYIIHQPVLIFLGLALSGIRLPHLLKFALVAPVAVALCFLLSNYIRKLPLARSIL
jgi:glucan biosynthesis protein C